MKAGRGVLPDLNSLPMWFFDLCNLESHDADRLSVSLPTPLSTLISAAASPPIRQSRCCRS